jgi:hypothetical protein
MTAAAASSPSSTNSTYIRAASACTNPEAPVGPSGGDARVLLRVYAAPIQKPLEYGHHGDKGALSVESRARVLRG